MEWFFVVIGAVMLHDGVFPSANTSDNVRIVIMFFGFSLMCLGIIVRTFKKDR